MNDDHFYCPHCDTPNQKGHPKRIGTTLAVIAVMVIGALLVSCNVRSVLTPQNNTEVNKFPPYQSKGITQQQNTALRQRYVMADLQLAHAFDAKQTSVNLHSSSVGNVSTSNGQNPSLVVITNNPVYEYYYQYVNDVDVNAAIINFVNGDLVINIYQFDRVNLENDGWQIVYGGTELIADAGDFVMASDIGGLNNEEARVRYIIADIQLGNVDEYYRQYLDQPAVAEAIKRWDNGVRVTNIDQFERKIVVNAGWKVVYLGTDQPVNGMDIQLSSDQLAQPQTTPDNCSFGVGRTAWIIADIQLGGVDSYYRQYLDQPEVAEAIRLWDSGVRVTNLDDFERKIVDDAGWQIVYAGTEQVVNCDDIQLSSGEVTNPTNNYLCNNPYFPAEQDASWTYSQEWSTNAGYQTSTYVMFMDYYPDIGLARISDRNVDGEMLALEEYRCDPSGWIFVTNGEAVPPENLMVDGMTVTANYFDKEIQVTIKSVTINVPMGTYQGYELCYKFGCNVYVKDIGLVHGTRGLNTSDPNQADIVFDLVAFEIP